MSNRFNDTTCVNQVIACLYHQPSLLGDERYKIYVEDFPTKLHKIIYAAMHNLYKQGVKEFTLPIINDYLAERPSLAGEYKQLGGDVYLQICEENVQPAAFEYNYSRFKKFSLLRSFDDMGIKLDEYYNPNLLLDLKKKQEQEAWLDNHSIADIMNIVSDKIDDLKLEYVDDFHEEAVEVSQGLSSLVQNLKESPDYGLPLPGKYINAITRGARLGKFYLRSASTGTGKAIPNNTLIPTPNGWRKVGDIKEGDYLFGQDGKPTKVLKTFPQPIKKDIWKVEFSDGRVAYCCGEHLWEYRYRGHRDFEYRVEDIQTIYNRALKLKNGLRNLDGKGFRFHIKMNEPLQYKRRSYFIDPYVMGLIIGDGSFRYNETNKAFTFSSKDEELPQVIANRLGKYIYKKNSNYNYTFKPLDNLTHNLWVEELLKDYPDTWNNKSEDKHIPQEYLFGDIEQRYDLLAGLLDTDGTIDEKGKVRFTTVSSILKDQVVELARSLGMITTIVEDKREEKYTTGICYEIHLQCKKEVKPKLFKLQRKYDIAVAYANSNKRSEYKDHLAIINIEKLEKETDMTCFTVDNNNHLFLMNDFIVTHNTRSMVADCCYIGCSEKYDRNKQEWVSLGDAQSCLFISTEQDLSEIQTLTLCYISQVNEAKILDGEYTDEEWQRIQKAIEILEKSKIKFISLPDFTLKQVEETIKKGIRENDSRYVFFDYIHSSAGILSEMTKNAGRVALAEHQVLFLMGIRLKEIAVKNDVFIESATQLNGESATSETPDQNLLRGAKSLGDKVDIGCLMLEVTEKDKELLAPICSQLGISVETINVKMSVYKARRGQWKSIYLWMVADRGICEFNSVFCTTWGYKLVDITDVKLNVQHQLKQEGWLF